MGSTGYGAPGPGSAEPPQTTNHALGRVTDSDAALAELVGPREQGWAYNIAYVYAFRGETDLAFEWLDKAVRYNDAGPSLIAVHVQFANIHENRRWLRFLEGASASRPGSWPPSSSRCACRSRRSVAAPFL